MQIFSRAHKNFQFLKPVLLACLERQEMSRSDSILTKLFQTHTFNHHFVRSDYRKGSNYRAKKNNSRRGLALELERKKSASICVAPYIDCTLEP